MLCAIYGICLPKQAMTFNIVPHLLWSTSTQASAPLRESRDRQPYLLDSQHRYPCVHSVDPSNSFEQKFNLFLSAIQVC